MTEWTTIQLRDACDSVDYGLTASASSQDTGTRFLRITDIVGHSLSWNDVPFVVVTEEQTDKYVVSPGDIVIARTGATTGVSRWLGSVPDSAVFASYLVRLKISDRYDSRFIGYALKGNQYWDYVRGVLGDKSAQPNASATTLAAAPLRVPDDLAEQRRIASVLGALDDKIAADEHLLDTVDDLGKALFERCFAEAFQYVIDGVSLPAGWKAADLGAATTTVETGSRPRGGVAKYASGVPSIGAESIVRLARFDFGKVKYVPEEFFAGMKRGVLQDRDILVYKDGGKPGDFKPHVSMFGNGFPFTTMCINEHVYRVRMNPELGQEFGYYWLSSAAIMGEMRRRGTGAAIPGINSTAVKGIPVVEPPVDRLSEFRSTAEPLVDRALQAAVESRTLATLRDTLLPQLMSGKLRVRDAERIVEDAV
ncbi:restriction endonuclease subunit S [Streptomyces sp. NBC_00996]|uniref:restriction endonuclease subunit S n=1 Tax=Streptomyces sp. NBC_00996 TaxID=2903710 RepID=UPI00386A4B69|nr:restriction endonuclease subunit S [Streptomyces sp. NBC_00996]